MYRNLFDTHAHYDNNRYDSDRDAVLSGLAAQGVSGVVNAACDMESCKTGLALARQYDFIYSSAGIHPHEAEQYSPENRDQIAAYAGESKVVAIGEIGLDYHYDFSPRETQRAAFEAQLALARDLALPVIIHNREAHADTLELLQKYRPQGILHCFSGSAELAREILKLGMYIAFGGAITFQNASKLLDAARAVPPERLLLETDCPYMSPVPFRGRRCDSTMMAYPAERLAQLHSMDVQALIDQTTRNALAVYRIDPTSLPLV